MHTPTSSTAAPHAAPPARPRRGGLTGIIRRFPLTAFFVLASALSWAGWTPYILSEHGLGLVRVGFPSGGGAQLLGILPGAYIGPLGAALVVTAAAGGREGLRAWRRRLFRLRVAWHWYPIVLIGVPVLLIGGTFLVPGAADEVTAPPAVALAAYLPALVLQVLTTGMAEEPGWRDFALPLMQRRLGPNGGTFLLGILWAVWHMPLFFTDWSLAGTRPDTAHWWTTVGVFFVMCLAISYLITWVFNHTKESLPIALLLHASNNTVASVILPEMFPKSDEAVMLSGGAIGYGVAAVVLLVVTRGRLGYKGPRDRM
ncbi:CAAX amino protease [Actinomadura rubrobrunea]|uniref:CAAX amino protease n=1 Tax=Actinomadura rubrobrunea TaxID=115335 RepID=A0A9W6PVD8_9ACTN|nr:CPBP family intramembrane glutamic endopeptidase [Actinomadura rubrobrunea]GLW65125.1 CAAX amino protease [Actinomadura rubrobrunea]